MGYKVKRGCTSSGRATVFNMPVSFRELVTVNDDVGLALCGESGEACEYGRCQVR